MRNRIRAIVLACMLLGSLFTYLPVEGHASPIISNPNPGNGITGISITPTLNVTVDDADDDILNASWYSNSSGPWALFATNSSIDTSVGGGGKHQPDLHQCYDV